MPDNIDVDSYSPDGGRFKTTHWSVVLAAGRSSATQYQQALSVLCETYWFPLYAFLRRRGYDSHQAQDYTQAFLTRLLEKHNFKQADPQRGKFRSFLPAALGPDGAGSGDGSFVGGIDPTEQKEVI